MSRSQQKDWTTRVDGTPAGTLLTTPNRFLLPTIEAAQPPRSATLHALNLTDGAIHWQVPFVDALISGTALAYEAILVATCSTDPLGQEGTVLALDLAGETLWRWAPGARSISAPAVVDNLVWVTVNTHTLVALDLDSGEERSSSILTETASLSTPVLAGDVAYIPCRGPHLLAADLDGAIRWRYAHGADNVWLDKTPLVVGERVFTVSSSSAVAALHAASGIPVWRVDVGPAGKPLTAPSSDGERLFVGARDGLHALALDSGAEVWHFETERKIEAEPVIHAGVVYATSHDHQLYALDAASGKELWRYEVDRRIEVPPVLADCDGTPCVVIADRGGTVTAVKRPLSAIEHEAAGHWIQAAAAYVEIDQPARAAQLLESHGEPLRAAELWEEAGELERAAEKHEAAGAWLQAVALWEQLGRQLRRAKALEAHARSLEAVACSSEDHAAAWTKAAQAYAIEGAERRAAICQGEAIRHLRLPVITMDVEIERGLVRDAWSRLRFIVRNEGFGPARRLFVRASGDQFKGQVMHTQEIITLRAGQHRSQLLDVCPQAYGEAVPLRVSVEYEDHAGQQRRCGQTIYIPVAREDSTRGAAQTINVFGHWIAGDGNVLGDGSTATVVKTIINGDVTGSTVATAGEDVQMESLSPGSRGTTVPSTKPAWNTAVMRRMLSQALSDEDLTMVCFDHFRPVSNDFALGMSKGQKIQRLLEFCVQQDRIEELLDCVKKHSPAQYERFKDRLRVEEVE
jgi:outer membrane protein assembly factor BamB